MVAIGVGVGWFQRRYRQPDASEDEMTRLHTGRQLRRRLQVSALMVLVGILIPVGDLAPAFRKAPVAFAIFWTAILGLLFWIMLLALGDFAAARSYHRLANLRIRQQRRELERQLDRYRAGGNGHSTVDSDE